MRYLKLLVAFAFCLLAINCKQTKKTSMKSDAAVLHDNVDELTQVIIYDVFSPPVASRIYGYTSLAQYEAMRFQDAKYASIAGQLNGFKPMPQPKKGLKYNYALAATKAFSR